MVCRLQGAALQMPVAPFFRTLRSGMQGAYHAAGGLADMGRGVAQVTLVGRMVCG